MSSASRTVVDELVAAMMARPESFICSEYTLKDTKTALEFWVSGSRFGAGVYSPYKLQFGMYQSARFHRALRAWKAWHATRKLRLIA